MSLPAVLLAGTQNLAVVLDAGLPGFPDGRRFLLSRCGRPSEPFSLLRSLDAGDLAFLVIRPERLFPDFDPVIDQETADRLELRGPADAAVYALVTLGEPPCGATVNLMAPLVVNVCTGHGAQIVLDGRPLAAPLGRR